MLRGERVPPRGGLHGGIGLEDARHRLLLQPLARVALVDARGRRELAGGERTPIAKRAIEPEPVPQVDAADLHGVESGLEQAAHEGVPLRGQGVGTVHDGGLSPPAAARGRPRA